MLPGSQSRLKDFTGTRLSLNTIYSSPAHSVQAWGCGNWMNTSLILLSLNIHWEVLIFVLFNHILIFSNIMR